MVVYCGSKGLQHNVHGCSNPQKLIKTNIQLLVLDLMGVYKEPRILANIVCCWVHLVSAGYIVKALSRLSGRIQWALRPGRGACLAGAYAWMIRSPKHAKCMPPKLLRGLLEATVCAMVPWEPMEALRLLMWFSRCNCYERPCT